MRPVHRIQTPDKPPVKQPSSPERNQGSFRGKQTGTAALAHPSSQGQPRIGTATSYIKQQMLILFQM